MIPKEMLASLSNQGIPLKTVGQWKVRDAITPKISHDSAGGEARLMVESNGSAGCYGGWEIVYEPGEGTYFTFRVRVSFADLRRGIDSVSAEAFWLDENGREVDWDPVFPVSKDGEIVVLEKALVRPDGAKQLAVRIGIRWSETGSMWWSRPELVKTEPPVPRMIRLGVASARPARGESIEKNREFFTNECRKAGEQGIGLVCLPEVILSFNLPRKDPYEVAVEVPGPHIEPFQEMAKKYGMGICFSVHEKNNELVHNTAVLIGKEGQLIGKYRKVHLASGEPRSGVTPGHDFPVFDFYGITVGMNICMDSSAMESARAIARQGAEVLLLPIMGDHRANRWDKGNPKFDFEKWLMVQRMRAMDNHIYLVAARNNSVGSGVFSPWGDVLAVNGGDRPILWADVNVDDLRQTWNGSTFKAVCWHERREPAYGPLAGETPYSYPITQRLR
jgi:predicted amidohydrolase